MGFDWAFVAKSLPLFGKAMGMTVWLAASSVAISLLIGFLCSLALYYRVRVIRGLVRAYIELSRNTPLLIQLFFLYYGLPKIGIKLSAQACAIMGLSFLGGSYMAESFRSGFESVSTIQLESGLSLGLSQKQLVRYVVMPQAFLVAMPGLSANGIFLLKETSIVSAIALADLMFVAKDLIGLYYNTTEALVMLVACYLVLLLPLSLLLTAMERRLRYGALGN